MTARRWQAEAQVHALYVMASVMMTSACLLLMVGSARAAAPLAVASMTTNAQTDPIGVGTAAPRLGWILASSNRDETQSAYQVLVASSLSVLAADHGDVWNSGVVESSNSVDVDYGGAELKAGVRYYWKARVWDQGDAISDWSAPAYWQMGLLANSDWGDAQWIGVPNPGSAEPQPAPYLRGDFSVKSG